MDSLPDELLCKILLDHKIDAWVSSSPLSFSQPLTTTFLEENTQTCQVVHAGHVCKSWSRIMREEKRLPWFCFFTYFHKQMTLRNPKLRLSLESTASTSFVAACKAGLLDVVKSALLCSDEEARSFVNEESLIAASKGGNHAIVVLLMETRGKFGLGFTATTYARALMAATDGVKKQAVDHDGDRHNSPAFYADICKILLKVIGSRIQFPEEVCMETYLPNHCNLLVHTQNASILPLCEFTETLYYHDENSATANAIVDVISTMVMQAMALIF